MNWKKKTSDQEDACVKLGDFTGGYDFLPWLVYMRWQYLIGFFGNIALGIGLLYSTLGDTFGTICGLFFGVVAPALIGVLLVRDYKKLKKGQSS